MLLGLFDLSQMITELLGFKTSHRAVKGHICAKALSHSIPHVPEAYENFGGITRSFCATSPSRGR